MVDENESVAKEIRRGENKDEVRRNDEASKQ